MKNIFALILSVILLFYGSIFSHAQTPTVELSVYDVAPCFEYTNTTATTLNISSSGKATCVASLNGYNGVTTKIVIKMTLQKDSWLWWSTEETWTTTINNCFGSLSKTKTVDSGTYRLKVEYTVYSGSNSEEITTYSQEAEF